MPTTVYFATNRKLSGPPEDVNSYTAEIVAPSDPGQLTYATAFVDNTDLTADKTGAIQLIRDVNQGGFSATAVADLSNPGRDVLVFIHGFANSFENAITRAAFNREWLAGAPEAAADTTVVAFSWSSLGREIAFPLLTGPYQMDQVMAGQSGVHLMDFFANLQPILQQAQDNAAASSCSPTAWATRRWRPPSKAGLRTATPPRRCSTRRFLPPPTSNTTPSIFPNRDASAASTAWRRASRSISAATIGC